LDPDSGGTSAQGEVIEELKIASTRVGIYSAFVDRFPCRIALEAGSHSPWMSETIAACGHEVIVANPRKVHLIGRSQKKTTASARKF
jgi:transposase